MMFIARSLSGILSSATTPTAMAFISDNAPQEERSKSMGQLGAMIGLGVILGPILGGLLSSDSLSLPFFVGAVLAFTAFLLVLAMLPESREKAADDDTETRQPRKPLRGVLREYRQVLFGPAGVLLLLILLISFGLANIQNMIGLYAVDKLGSDTQQVSAIWMVMGVTMIAVQGGLVGWLSNKVKERTIIRLSLLGGIFGFMFITLAVDFIYLMGALAFLMLTLSLLSPTLNAAISEYGDEHQGALMGLNNAMISLGRVLGPLWGGYVYDINMNFSFYSGALILVLGLGVSLVGIKKKGK